MTRGTTPSYKITFADEINLSDVDSFYVTLKQDEQAKLTRKDPSVDGDSLVLTLTQEETLHFKEGMAFLQVRGKFTDGTAFATKVIPVPVHKVLYDEVI